MDLIRKRLGWIPTILMGILFLGMTPMFECKSELKVGSAVNIFKRFGFLSVSVRVVQRSDSGWVFREPTNDLFQSFRPSPSPPPVRARGRVPEFEGDFQMEFCDTASHLLEAYFRCFTIERVDRPWRVFSASWTKGACAQNFGLNATYVGDSYSYILVRLLRYRSSERMTSTENRKVRFEEIVESEVIPGNITSLQIFFRDFGTHYISSYTTGDALYQVFVYQKPLYKRIKDRIKAEHVRSINLAELSSYFSPWYAIHTGRILSASGKSNVEAWAAEQLTLPFYLFSFQSLIQIHAHPALLRSVDSLLGDEAVLKLELRSLATAFADKQRRKWFDEVLDNQLKLWETNMCEECFSAVNGHNGCPPQQTSSEVKMYNKQDSDVYKKSGVRS